MLSPSIFLAPAVLHLPKIGTFGTSVTLYRLNIIRSPKLYLHSDTSPQDIPRIRFGFNTLIGAL